MTTSAERMKIARDKLTSQGLVRRDVWILPENSEKLKKVEKKLRKP